MPHDAAAVLGNSTREPCRGVTEAAAELEDAARRRRARERIAELPDGRTDDREIGLLRDALHARQLGRPLRDERLEIRGHARRNELLDHSHKLAKTRGSPAIAVSGRWPRMVCAPPR